MQRALKHKNFFFKLLVWATNQLSVTGGKLYWSITMYWAECVRLLNAAFSHDLKGSYTFLSFLFSLGRQICIVFFTMHNTHTSFTAGRYYSLRIAIIQAIKQLRFVIYCSTVYISYSLYMSICMYEDNVAYTCIYSVSSNFKSWAII